MNAIESQPSPPRLEEKQLPEPQQTSSWFGLTIRTICQSIAFVIQKIFWALSQIFSNVSAIIHSIKLLGYSSRAHALSTGKKPLQQLNARASETYSFLDTFQIFDTTYDLLSCKEKPLLNTMGNIAILIAQIAGTFLFLAEVALINLDAIKTALAKVPVIGLVTRISLDSFVTTLVGTAFLFFACSAVRDLTQAKSHLERGQALLDLASSVVECTLRIFVLFAASQTVWIVILGCTAASLGLSSFIYSRAITECAQT